MLEWKFERVMVSFDGGEEAVGSFWVLLWSLLEGF